MDKNQEFYLNRRNYGEICVPVRKGVLNYLIKEKFLSEFSTEEEKLRVLENLGILSKFELLQQLLDNKLDLSLLSRFITKEEFNRRILELALKDEKSKGYFSSYEELIANNPFSSLGDWAIVNVEGTKYIYRFTNSGWTLGEIFEMELNLSEYAKLTDLELLQDLLISGVNIKTINGQSILGQGNLEIQPEQDIDLSEYVTEEYLYNIQNSLEAEIAGLKTRVQALELNPTPSGGGDSIKHIFLTQSAYDALETYELDTLYLIIEQTSSGGSKLGEDTFPLILS